MLYSNTVLSLSLYYNITIMSNKYHNIIESVDSISRDGRKGFTLPNLHYKNSCLCKMEWIYIQGKMKGSILFELALKAMKNKSRKTRGGEKFIVRGPSFARLWYYPVHIL